MQEKTKKSLPSEAMQERMAEFFMKTSIPRLLAKSEKELDALLKKYEE